MHSMLTNENTLIVRITKTSTHQAVRRLSIRLSKSLQNSKMTTNAATKGKQNLKRFFMPDSIIDSRTLLIAIHFVGRPESFVRLFILFIGEKSWNRLAQEIKKPLTALQSKVLICSQRRKRRDGD